VTVKVAAGAIPVGSVSTVDDHPGSTPGGAVNAGDVDEDDPFFNPGHDDARMKRDYYDDCYHEPKDGGRFTELTPEEAGTHQLLRRLAEIDEAKPAPHFSGLGNLKVVPGEGDDEERAVSEWFSIFEKWKRKRAVEILEDEKQENVKRIAEIDAELATIRKSTPLS
jgi:hypothetical protein